MFLSIVIAVYNEEENIKELTERIYNSMNKLKIPFELIYVIDGEDNSYDIVKNMKKKNLIIDYSRKLRGFKNAFAKGFSLVNAKATHVLTMDADLNHQPEEIGKLINIIDGADIAIGSRYTEKAKLVKLVFWRKAVSKGANFIIKTIWGIKLKDKTSGYRVYKKKVIDRIVPLCKSSNFEFLFEILILARKFKYRIKEVPITFVLREKGESKFDFLKASKGYFKLMLRSFFRKWRL